MKRFLMWFTRKLGWNMIVVNSAVMDDLIITAAELCKRAEKTYGDQSGEFRRHQVYAAMLKLFPKINKRDICLAIEFGVRHV